MPITDYRKLMLALDHRKNHPPKIARFNPKAMIKCYFFR